MAHRAADKDKLTSLAVSAHVLVSVNVEITVIHMSFEFIGASFLCLLLRLPCRRLLAIW